MKKTTGIVTLCALVLSSFLALTACGATEVSVEVIDQLASPSQLEDTKILTTEGTTVSQALEEAGITVGEQDVTVPAMDSQITDTTKTITIRRYANVTVDYDGKTKNVELVGKTVADALEEAGITLSADDAVTPAKTTPLTDGMEIVVEKRVPVSIIADGRAKAVTTGAVTVNQLLKAEKISVSEEDLVIPDRNSKVKSGTQIVVRRVSTKEETVTQSIPFSTEYSSSNTMEKGTSKVIRNGQNGSKTVTARVTYVDGIRTNYQVLKETILKQPVAKIVTKGTKEAPKKQEKATTSKKSSTSSPSSSDKKTTTSEKKSTNSQQATASSQPAASSKPATSASASSSSNTTSQPTTSKAE